MNSKTVLWGFLAVIVLLPSTWFAWSVYQRSENEKLLNSVWGSLSNQTKNIVKTIETIKSAHFHISG